MYLVVRFPVLGSQSMWVVECRPAYQVKSDLVQLSIGPLAALAIGSDDGIEARSARF